MPDWLRDSILSGDLLPTSVICSRVALSWAAGFAVTGVYLLGLGRRKTESQTLPTTLVLLTVVIALVTMVIGDSIARAFGLVGALSIVRFRTVVEDTRDTAFVIFAVVVGMAIGAGYSIVAVVGLPAVLLAALGMQHFMPDAPAGSNSSTLMVRIGLGRDPELLFAEVFTQHLAESRLIGTATARQGAVLELTYQVRLRTPNAVFAFVADLNRVEGVQGVELRAA